MALPTTLLSTIKLNDFVTNIIYYYQNMKSEEMLEVIDVKRLVTDVIDKNNQSEAGNEITIEHNVSMSGTFKADAHRLRMILNNVVGNAIRYQDNSKVDQKVDIQVVQNMEQAVFRITDNGIGIDDELLPHIFDMFTKSDENNVGAGVGLYIAQEAARKLSAKPDNDTLLELYSYFKQGSQGDVCGDRPGAFDFVARAKYDAWAARQGMSREVAMRGYIKLVGHLQSLES